MNLFFFILSLSLIRSQQLDLYVSYNETDNLCSDSDLTLNLCGTRKNPFISLLQSFYYIDLNMDTINSEYQSISLLLINKIYIIDIYNVTYYLNKLNEYFESSDPVWFFLQRMYQVSLEIKPLISNMNVIIELKTFFLSFFVSDSTLMIRNITIDGKDIDYPNSEIAPPCLYWKIGCCRFNNCPMPFITEFLGNAINIFTIIGESTFQISFCNIVNLNLKQACNIKNIHIDGFILVESSFAIELSISDTIIENVHFKSFFIGSFANDYSLLALKGVLIFSWINNSIRSINVEQSSQNSTFRLFFLEEIYFTDSKFEKIENFLTCQKVGSLFFENCTIYGNFKSDKQPSPFYYTDIQTYLINITNTYFMEGFFLNKILSVISVTNLMRNVMFLNQNFINEEVFSFQSTSNYIVNVTFAFNSYNKSLLNVLIIACNHLIMKNIIFLNLNPDAYLNILFYSVTSSFLKNLMIRNQESSRSKINLIFDFCSFANFSEFIYQGGSISIKYPLKLKIEKGMFKLLSDENLNFLSSNSLTEIIIHFSYFENFESNLKGSIFNLQTNNLLKVSQTFFGNLKCFKPASFLSASSSNVIKLENIIFLELKSFEGAGGIYLLNENILIIISCIVKQYETVGNGGFILAIQQKNFIKIYQSHFKDGFSTEGSVLFLNYNSFVFIESSSFSNNTADYEGGTFKFNFYATVFIKDVMINGSFSYGRAGIMSSSQENHIKVLGSIFNDSFAKSASIFNLNSKSTIILSNCTYLKVIALQHGGLFLLFSENLMILKNTSISEFFQEQYSIISIVMKNIIFAENVRFLEFFTQQDFFLIGNNNKLVISNLSYAENSLGIVGVFFNLDLAQNFLFIFNISSFFMKADTIIRSSLNNSIYLKRLNLNNIKVKKIAFDIQKYTFIIMDKISFVIKNKDPTKFVDPIQFIRLTNYHIIIRNFTFHANSNQNLQLGYFHKSKILFKIAKISRGTYEQDQEKLFSSHLYSKMIINIGSLLICFSSAFLFHPTIVKKYNKLNSQNGNGGTLEKIHFKFTLKSVIFISLSLCSTNFIRDCLNMFSYQNIAEANETPELRLIEDYEIIFDSNIHNGIKYFLVLPILIFMGLIFPMFILYQIIQKKKKDILKDKKNLFVYGFFFFYYKKRRSFWEFIFSTTKLIIQIVAVFVNNFANSAENNLKNLFLLLILIILIFYMQIQSKLSPYKRKFHILNRIEEGSFISLSLSSAILLIQNIVRETYSVSDSSKAGYTNTGTLLINIPLSFLISINGIFYIAFLSLYFKYSNLKKAFKLIPKRFRRNLKTVKKFKIDKISIKKIIEDSYYKYGQKEDVKKNSGFDFLQKAYLQNEVSNLLPILKKKSKKITYLNEQMTNLKSKLNNIKYIKIKGMSMNCRIKKCNETKIQVPYMFENKPQVIFKNIDLSITLKFIILYQNEREIKYEILIKFNEEERVSKTDLLIFAIEKERDRSLQSKFGFDHYNTLIKLFIYLFFFFCFFDL